MIRNRTLLGILTVSLILKLAVWWVVTTSDPSRFLARDSVSYHNSARALVEKGVFAVSPERPEIPQTARTPGYPVFLAAIYALFGPRPAPAIAVQILFSLATIAFAWKLAAERWGSATAHLAAMLLALDLASFSHSLLLLTETLFTFLLCGVLYSALRFSTGAPARRWAFALGLGLALSTLVRPVAYYLAVPLVAWVAVVAWRTGRSWRRSAGACVLFLLPWAMLIGGWHLRNAVRTGTPVFCSIEGVNLLYFRGAGIVALRDGISIHQAREQLGKGRYRELHPETRDWSDQRLSERWKREGLELILSHPLLFARIEGRALAATFLGTGEHTLMRLLAIPIPPTGPLGDLVRLDFKSYLERWLIGRPSSFLACLLSLSFLALLYLGAASSLLRSLLRLNLGLWDGCVWGIFFYLALIAAGPEAYHRFRVPITPILCLFAARGLPALWQSVRARSCHDPRRSRDRRGRLPEP